MSLLISPTPRSTSLISVYRVDLHNELLRLASTDDGSDGGEKEMKLILDSRVVSTNAEEGSIELTSGSVKKADLNVADNVVHSVLRSIVLGQEAPKAMVTELGAFRFLIQTSDLQDDPEAVELSKWKCKGPIILADMKGMKSERHAVWYDCQG